MELTLYNIRKEHLELQGLLDENGGELTPEVEEKLALTEEHFRDKAVSVGFVVKSYDDSIGIIEAEIERLKKLKASAEKKKEFLKERLDAAMKQFGIQKIDTPTLKLSYRKSTYVEVDEDVLPKEYWTKPLPPAPAPNKQLIAAALKQGTVIVGASIKERYNLQIL